MYGLRQRLIVEVEVVYLIVLMYGHVFLQMSITIYITVGFHKLLLTLVWYSFFLNKLKDYYDKSRDYFKKPFDNSHIYIIYMLKQYLKKT